MSHNSTTVRRATAVVVASPLPMDETEGATWHDATSMYADPGFKDMYQLANEGIRNAN